MKKNWKRVLAFLTAVSCLAGSHLSAFAAQTGEAEAVPRVTFENEEKNSPDLYIKKNVENASENDPAPAEDTFFFILKLDGDLASRTIYKVYGADGKEIVRTKPMPGIGTGGGNGMVDVPDPFKTDGNGGFTLQAGQTAVFENVGSGVSYEVTERSREGYQQVIPADGAAAVGTVTAKGAGAEFTNLYQPAGTGGKTRLEVRKTVSFPSGYEMPETPAFPFRVKLDGKWYANEPYVVKDTATGKEIAEEAGQTDTQGIFYLKGGRTAVFEDVELPRGVEALDYRVEELSLEGEASENWRPTGSAVREGATTSPVTPVVFNNASASFAVTKQMEDGSKPDVEFTFLLTKADRTVWGEASYYKYNTTGELAEEAVQKTEADGTFTLKPGQTAVFIGMKQGTVYNVSEQGTGEYIQTVPSGAEGYTDKVVTDAVEVLTFVNRQAEKERSLNVTKVVKNTTEEAPFAQDTFHFILSKKNQAGEYEPVGGAVYRIQAGDSEYTYATRIKDETVAGEDPSAKNETGAFTLKAGETARFTGIAAGEYQVTEVDLTLEYRDRTKEENGTVLQAGGTVVESGEVLLEGAPLNLTFVNWYTPKKLNLNITKKNRSKEALSGAKFQIYQDEALENPLTDSAGEPAVFTTGADGTLAISDLKTGTYYLVEREAPAGYRLLTNPIKLELARHTDGNLSIFVDGEDRTSANPADDCYAVQKDDANDEVYITVYNSRNFALPLTGGRGIGWNLLAGAFLVALLLWMSRKKRRPEIRS